jgi:hypothetical protein
MSSFSIPSCVLVLSLTFAALPGCGKQSSNAVGDGTAPSLASRLLETQLTGTWIEVACEEGYAGPDAPPPTYSKGIVKFVAGNNMRWSAKIFDDNKCSVQRPGTVEEVENHYTVVTPSATTDGSVQVDVQTADENGDPYVLYGIVKVKAGMLYIAMYPTAAKRPKVMDEHAAQVFTVL